MILSARQLQEKCQEQHAELFITCVKDAQRRSAVHVQFIQRETKPYKHKTYQKPLFTRSESL